jgi:hypothetical protein
VRLVLKTLFALAGIAAIAGFIAGPYLLGETDSGRKLYVKGNEKLLDGLPVPPGAEELERRSYPYYAAKEDAPVAGYRTRALFQVSSMTALDVIAFYRAELPRWKTRVHGTCRTSCRFVRGNSELVVNARDIANARTYSVVADYTGAQS